MEKKEENTDQNGRLTREQEYRIDQRIRIGVIIAAAFLLVYLLYCGMKKIPIGTGYFVVVVIFVAVYWLLSDVISLKLKHGFAGRTQKQKTAYYKMMAVDFVGAVGLMMFLIGLNDNRSIMGAMLYLFGVMSGRKFRAEYEKDPSEEEKEEEEKEHAAADISALPTAKDRSSRQMTTAERLQVLNQQAAEAAEPDDGDAAGPSDGGDAAGPSDGRDAAGPSDEGETLQTADAEEGKDKADGSV